MTLRVRLTPAAQSDLDQAQDWYDSASFGLGSDFLDEVEATLRALGDWPDASPVVADPIRRALVGRFPYGVYYSVEGNEITVLGVVHVRRHPRVWKSRTS